MARVKHLPNAGERAHECTDVLARLEIAQVQQVRRVPQSQTPPYPFVFDLRLRLKMRVNTVIDDSKASMLWVHVTQEVILRAA
jgi:hypothetical protein